MFEWIYRLRIRQILLNQGRGGSLKSGHEEAIAFRQKTKKITERDGELMMRDLSDKPG